MAPAANVRKLQSIEFQITEDDDFAILKANLPTLVASEKDFKQIGSTAETVT